MEYKEDKFNNILKIVIFSVILYGLLSFYDEKYREQIIIVSIIIYIILHVYHTSVSVDQNK